MQALAAVPHSEHQRLLLLESGRRAIRQARTIQEVKDIRDKAEALRVYARQQAESLEIQNDIAEIRIRAERRAGELLGRMDKAGGARGQLQGREASGAPIVQPPEAEPPTLADLGISKAQSSRWQQIAALPAETFEEHIQEVKEKGGELTSAGLRRLAQQHRQAERRADLKERALDEVVDGRYVVVYADPPWQYQHDYLPGAAARHYPTLPTQRICALPVSRHTTDNAVLFLWSTNPQLQSALEVMGAWGFRYVTNLVWVKDRQSYGLHGFYAYGRHELLLIGIKGSLQPEHLPVSVIEAPRREHSRKPDEVYELIERMYPGLSYLELFARRTRRGWDVFGNEV